MDQQLKLVCISDTHGRVINNLPSGDILIHCGDFTLYGEFEDAFDFLEWFKKQNFKYKVFVAGNHDNPFYYKTKKNNNSNRQKLIDELEEKIKNLREEKCYYLENDSVIIEGYKIWGSPHSLKIWGREERPFQIQPAESENLWDKLIPNDADIVILIQRRNSFFQIFFKLISRQNLQSITQIIILYYLQFVHFLSIQILFFKFYQSFIIFIFFRMQEEEITFVCMSDTHSLQIDLPQGDVLIHAGDFSNVGEKQDILCFIQWLKQLFKQKLIIAGNHEIDLDVQNYRKLRRYYKPHNKEFDPQELMNANYHYLENSSVIVGEYKIWGCPYSLEIKKTKHFWREFLKSNHYIIFLVTYMLDMELRKKKMLTIMK